MRRAVVAVAAAILLLGPTAIAFFSGGYFTEPRVIAALVAWLLVLLLAITGPNPWPDSTSGRIAVLGLGGLTAWTGASIAWAPLHGPALDSTERLLLYTGALLVAAGTLRIARVRRATEPALAAGATIVIGYGLSGRLLPGIVHLTASKGAFGRLEQPITYWNGEGALAALGLVLCARLAGDPTRHRATRIAAAAAVAPLGAGVYLSFSRGAIAAGVAGLVALVAAAPTTDQLRAAAAALATAIVAAAVTATTRGVSAMDGPLADREREGALVLAGLILVAAVAAALTAITTRRERDTTTPPRWARHVRAVATAFAVLVAAGLIAGGIGEKPSAKELSAGASATRLTSVSSNRYEYWRVGLRAFEQHALKGLGAGGFRVFWLKERSIGEAVHDVHSLELEMAAELGVVGLLLFALLAGGTAAAARDALRRHPAEAAGCMAALVAWLLHASIDWDWQLPAVSLPAIALAGALIALSGEGERER
jgi:O-antigen ligase